MLNVVGGHTGDLSSLFGGWYPRTTPDREKWRLNSAALGPTIQFVKDAGRFEKRHSRGRRSGAERKKEPVSEGYYAKAVNSRGTESELRHFVINLGTPTRNPFVMLHISFEKSWGHRLTIHPITRISLDNALDPRSDHLFDTSYSPFDKLYESIDRWKETGVKWSKGDG